MSREWQYPVDSGWVHVEEAAAARQVLAERLPQFARRREHEHALADMVHALDGQPGTEGMHLTHLAGNLWECRCDGVAGVVPRTGKLRIMWAKKCRQPKLCEDEARGEALRLYDRYAPSIQVAAARGWRQTYAVFTCPNVRAGRLWPALRYWWRKLARFLRRRGLSAIVTMECPLALDGHSWNLHFNLILLSRNWLDYGALRASWGQQIQFAGQSKMAEHFRRRYGREGSPAEVLASAFRELIKYSAKVAGESDPATGESALPMTAWPPASWLEWWRAMRGHRRSRGYGSLYDPEGIRWAASSRAERQALCERAEVDPARAGDRWRVNRDAASYLPTGIRRGIREALRAPAPEPTTWWVGAVSWVRHIGYSFRAWRLATLDLIPGQQVTPGNRPGRMDKSANSPAWGIYPVGSSP